MAISGIDGFPWWWFKEEYEYEMMLTRMRTIVNTVHMNKPSLYMQKENEFSYVFWATILQKVHK